MAIFKKVCILVFVCLVLSSWSSKAEHPRTIKVQQIFQAGDKFSYCLTEICTSDLRKGTKLTSQKTAIFSLKVSQVSRDEIMDIIITKTAGSSTMHGQTFPDPDVGKQVRIRFCPDGKIKTIEGDVKEIKWRELILRNLPPQEIKVGDSWKSSYPLPEEFGWAGETRREYKVLGFEKIKGFDCVKVSIESVTETKGRKLKKVLSSIKSDKEVSLAYKRGYLVVKSHTIFETKIGTTISVRETTVELLK